jgi:hypothetical protein
MLLILEIAAGIVLGFLTLAHLREILAAFAIVLFAAAGIFVVLVLIAVVVSISGAQRQALAPVAVIIGSGFVREFYAALFRARPVAQKTAAFPDAAQRDGSQWPTADYAEPAIGDPRSKRR